ncbi:PQ-loop repeat-containing protein 1 [Apophysomyces ossiformis]|uniref:PQ-loop repeat-containing protein 1 n=1 Tax=Apophysomyces ossiformis TaxID=679940 RepID=A0A8H7BSM3_9FUNG|nr:PQ-loop repeat-containing protein 1 [Apophysomyces ossiformis]
MTDLASLALSAAMVFAPVVGYIDQYFIIRRTQSSAGFNPKTCAILLFANILRIYFWLGKRFDTTLLIQSIAMIVAQLILLHTVVRFRLEDVPGNGVGGPTEYSRLREDEDGEGDEDVLRAKTHTNPSLCQQCYRSFWNWPHYLDYMNCLLTFTTIVGALYLGLHRYTAFIELLGALSLGIESTLPLPQCLYNFARRSTDGFSLLVLGSWFLGDGFKLGYFIYTDAPLQFDICGAIQLTIDTVIVLQFILFSPRVKKWLGIAEPMLVASEADSGQHVYESIP